MWDILAGQAWKNAESKGLLRGKTLRDHVEGILSEIEEAEESWVEGKMACVPFRYCKFEESYKDTHQDEIADIFLRTLTMCKEFDIEIDMSIAWFCVFNFNVEEDLRDMKRYCHFMKKGIDKNSVCSFLYRIIQYCEMYSIPLAWHMQEKMKYNKSRPFLHGKVDIS